MNKDRLGRRELLKSLLIVPAGCAVGCQTSAQLLPPDESLKKLVLAIGPWTSEERELAENFASRFLNSNLGEIAFAPENRAALQQLATRFEDGEMAVSRVPLDKMPADEEELLLSLVKQLYDLIEVRFHLGGDPPYGECQIDVLKYTRPPG